jgi:putative heme iron utilization protein
MSDPFSPEVSDRICKHMNEDHADAIALYARTFGKVEGAIAAQMVTIDAHGMNLAVQVGDTTTPIRIEFDHVLQDASDAHHTLVDMVKQARQHA